MQRPGHTQQRPRAHLAPCPPRLHVIVLRWLEGHGGSIQICRANCTCQDVGAWGACGGDLEGAPQTL